MPESIMQDRITLRVSPDNEADIMEHVRYLKRTSDEHGALSDALNLALRNSASMLRDKAAWAPIYNRYYLLVEEGEGGSPVHFPDWSGETDGWTGYLRQATDEDDVWSAAKRGWLFVRVEHQLEYPYGVYDAEGVEQPGDAEKRRLLRLKPERRLYCRAALVATPQMSLVGG